MVGVLLAATPLLVTSVICMKVAVKGRDVTLLVRVDSSGVIGTNWQGVTSVSWMRVTLRLDPLPVISVICRYESM